MRIIKSTPEFAKEFPVQFKALPEPYQNDDCLEYLIVDDKIICYPKPGQESGLGYWSCLYDQLENRWLLENRLV